MTFWEDLSQPQATVLGAVVTGLCALAAIWLGATIFSDKIKGLEGAIRASQNAVNSHLTTTEAAVRKTAEEIKTAIENWSAEREEQKQLVSSISDQVVNIANAQAEEDFNRDAGILQDIGPVDIEDEAAPTRGDIRSAWADIQAAIEAVARQPHINGRTRAKYARQDRRAYADLISMMKEDGNLSDEVASAAEKAFSLRNSFRRRAEEPTAAERAYMEDLRAMVLSAAPPDEQ